MSNYHTDQGINWGGVAFKTLLGGAALAGTGVALDGLFDLNLLGEWNPFEADASTLTPAGQAGLEAFGALEGAERAGGFFSSGPFADIEIGGEMVGAGLSSVEAASSFADTLNTVAEAHTGTLPDGEVSPITAHVEAVREAATTLSSSSLEGLSDESVRTAFETLSTDNMKQIASDVQGALGSLPSDQAGAIVNQLETAFDRFAPAADKALSAMNAPNWTQTLAGAGTAAIAGTGLAAANRHDAQKSFAARLQQQQRPAMQPGNAVGYLDERAAYEQAAAAQTQR